MERERQGQAVRRHDEGNISSIPCLTQFNDKKLCQFKSFIYCSAPVAPPYSDSHSASSSSGSSSSYSSAKVVPPLSDALCNFLHLGNMRDRQKSRINPLMQPQVLVHLQPACDLNLLGLLISKTLACPQVVQ